MTLVLVLDPVPAVLLTPLDRLILELAGRRHDHGTHSNTNQSPWLIAGNYAGQPISAQHLTRCHNEIGICARPARNTTVNELAAELPVVVPCPSTRHHFRLPLGRSHSPFECRLRRHHHRPRAHQLPPSPRTGDNGKNDDGLVGESSVCFLAPGDAAAAATRLRGPGEAFETVTCRFIEPDRAIAEWDMYFEQPSAEPPPLEQLLGWTWPEWVATPVNDGVEVFALPKRLTRALANASSAELEELAGRWTTRLWSEDGDDMTDDDLLAVLHEVARLAGSAVKTESSLYSWSF
ncbi:hypothetical protein [Streptomyces sp. NPDC058307]|uniref:hypothetical protein n=1 Tax=Streptomyces sp. NPDC058307 TaxID=3346439 RepID=UPI0036EFC794